MKDASNVVVAGVGKNTGNMARDIATGTLTMMLAHDQASKTPGNRIRKGDGLPFGVHPAFTGFLMLHEASIPVPKRLIYADALTHHDYKEDTDADLSVISPEALRLVEQLTFEDGLDNTTEAIARGPEIAMLKSYDTFGNLFGLDQIDWPMDKKLRRLEKAVRLFAAARPHYPDLYIWPLADALVATISARLDKSA